MFQHTGTKQAILVRISANNIYTNSKSRVNYEG